MEEENIFVHDRDPVKHSGLGIASFIIGLVVLVILTIVFVYIIGILSQSYYISESDPRLVAVGVVMMVGMLLSGVGIILSIIGLSKRTRKRIFPILGIVINGLIVVFVIFLIILGLASE